MDEKRLWAYEKTGEEWIAELASTAVLYRHKKTGARVFTLKNEDENKVFMIGFRTPVQNSTGVPHILEHSVLCGSEKYPVKDPFVELAKGSLNTFLNAMTYPDKTVYPIASCNDKDFQNLMDIYLDAVFHPNIYQNEKILQQEGWHYELYAEEEELTYSGVVYNEMIGAFSSPESLLERRILNSLFPDTTYAHESGGDPEVIPELTKEEFLDFHRTYYHPSNSYIYLYGKMDMEEKLEWIDENYLSGYSAIEVDSEIKYQSKFEHEVEDVVFYPITDGEDEDAYLSLNTVVGDAFDEKQYVAFPVLEYALIDAPGAPLKQALLDAGMGKDIYGGYEDGILQPYFSLVAKGADYENRAAFYQLIRETLQRLAKEGIGQKALLAGLNRQEFKFREADFGSYPRGLMHGLQCFDSWLYGEGDPLLHLKYEETLTFLKENLDKGYFESLITDTLLDNPHTAKVAALPQKGLSAQKEQALARKLAAIKASWSEEELAQVIEKTEALDAYQSEPSPREELEKIPLLAREDITREVQPVVLEKKQVEGELVLHTELFTSGISYVRLLFDVEDIPEEELGYLSLLEGLLGVIDTEHYSYQDLNNEIAIHSGGIVPAIGTYPMAEGGDGFAATFEFSAKVLQEKVGFALDMIEEIACHSVFCDEKRLWELLNQYHSRMQARFMASGHAVACMRASSYHSPLAAFNEAITGITAYQFLDTAIRQFDEKKEELLSHCEALARRIFCRERLLIAYTGEESGYALFAEKLPALVEKLPHGERGRDFAGRNAGQFTLRRRQEGFLTSAGVQYVARSGNFRKKGLPYTGALWIARTMLNYDYMWQEIRVKGGAYGCMSGFRFGGDGHFVSYRDPNLEKTNQVYEGIPAYFAAFEEDERELTKYIIGSISSLDTPLNPNARGNRAVACYLSGMTDEMRQQERDEILDATAADVRALAFYMQAILEDNNFCVIGNEGKILEQRALFEDVKALFE